VIGEALAFRAQNRFGGTFRVLDADLRTAVVSEIELGEIAVQMSLADRVINAVDAALWEC
jgi:hypothetical protein